MLRVLLVALLGVLLVRAARDEASAGERSGGVLRVEEDGSIAAVDGGSLGALTGSGPLPGWPGAGPGRPSRIVRLAPDPPDDAELRWLEGAGVPVTVAVPARTPPLRVAAPRRPVAGRPAALEAFVAGRPGDTVRVRLDGDAPPDSLDVPLDGAGRGRAAFRVTPGRAGWHRWVVRTGEAEGTTGAWVRQAAPVRVLVRAGPPMWETRFVVRALEEAGGDVTLHQRLGRGLWVGGRGEAPPLTAAALADRDVVLLLPGARLEATEGATLVEWVEERGGGVLVAGADGPVDRLGLGGPGGPPTREDGGAPDWYAPPELTALGPPPPAWTGRPFEGAAVGSRVVAATPAGEALVAVRPAGRGRAARVGIADTWRWRMEAGAVETHGRFWTDLVDWLAGGLREPVVLEAPAGPLTAPAEVVVRTVGFQGTGSATPAGGEGPGRPGRASSPGAADPVSSPAAAPLPVWLVRPGGGRETLASVPPGREGRVRFLADVPGVYALGAGGDSAPVVALEMVEAAPAHPLAWASAARIAAGSGGGPLPPEEAREAARSSGRGPLLPPGVVFLLLVSLALADWTVRRTGGLA